jgi:hypothetical protein
MFQVSSFKFQVAGSINNEPITCNMQLVTLNTPHPAPRNFLVPSSGRNQQFAACILDDGFFPLVIISRL